MALKVLKTGHKAGYLWVYETTLEEVKRGDPSKLWEECAARGVGFALHDMTDTELELARLLLVLTGKDDG
jgi:hypothetical protein